MKKNTYLPLTLIVAVVLSGCNSMPKNSSLADAHSSYDSASSNAQVASLAALELKTASVTLDRGDSALKGETTATVNQIAYLAKQQVAIAQATAKRKAAELAVTNADTKRDKIRLAADSGKTDAAKQQVAVVQETADWQAAELAAATANAERDQDTIAQQELQLNELKAKKTERGLMVTLVMFCSALIRRSSLQVVCAAYRSWPTS